MRAGKTVKGTWEEEKAEAVGKEREIYVIDEQTLRLFAPSIQLKGNREPGQNLSQDASLH